MSIKFRKANGLTDKALIRYMDAECFPDDAPFKWDNTHWHIGEWITQNGATPAAYCAWKSIDLTSYPIGVGFLYRTGVMPDFRGSGLQKEMITIREEQMLDFGYNHSVTCTEVTNMASIYSLIKMGYKPYAPGDYPNVAHDVPSMHWFKVLK